MLTQVEQEQKRPGTASLDKARYHRDQAALCLQMARLISDPIAARLMRMAAARHFEQVAELEALSTDPSGTLRGDDKGRDDFSDSFYYRVIRTPIGEALRSQLVPTEPPPGKLLDLLQALDQSRADDAGPQERLEQSNPRCSAPNGHLIAARPIAT